MDQLALPGGRRLDVFVSGPAGGLPFVFFHGTPGAALPIRAVERAVHRRGLRLVSFSRPGYGDSGRRRGRRVVDVVDDAAAVLAELDAPRCLVGGWSGGGPHALACGARLLGAAAVMVVAGVGPYGAPGLDFLAGMGEDNVVEFGAALEGEGALRELLGALRQQLEDVDAASMIEGFGSLLPDVDRAALAGEFGEDVLAWFGEGLRTGVDGWLDDDLAFTQPWGFELDEIEVPAFLWQGDADRMVPVAHGRYLAANLPGSVAHLEVGAGHLSLLAGGIERMLDEVASSPSA